MTLTSTGASAPTGATTIRFDLRVLDTRVACDATVPSGPTRPRRLLPVLQQLTAVLSEVAVEREAAAGRTVSCKAGCGACCNQLVPITEPESLRIAEVVKAMPEPRRTEIKARFAAAREKLAERGVLEPLAEHPAPGAPSFWGLAQRYFESRVPCPFLDEGSCSIYRDRPLICREYLVTTPAEHCEDPFVPGRVKGVPMPGRASTTLGRVQRALCGGSEKDRSPPPWVALTEALEFAKTYRDTATPRPGPELLRLLVDDLT